MTLNVQASWSDYLLSAVGSLFNFSNNEPTADSDDEKSEGDDINWDSTHLLLANPRYKVSVLRRICESGPHFTSLEVTGDWSKCVRDLSCVVPHLVEVRKVVLSFSNVPCSGTEDLFSKIATLPKLVSFDTRKMFYSCESLEEILNNHSVRKLYLNEASLQRNPDDLDAILFAVDPNYGNCRLFDFEGVTLNKYLRLWNLEEAGLQNASNREILKFVRDLNAHKNEEEEEDEDETHRLV